MGTRAKAAVPVLIYGSLRAAVTPAAAALAALVFLLYPAFLRPGTATARDWDELVRLDWLVWPFLALAAAVPLAGVALLVVVGSQNWQLGWA